MSEGNNQGTVTESFTEESVPLINIHRQMKVVHGVYSVGKATLTATQDVNDVVVHAEFLPTGVTINSESYVRGMQKFEARVQRARLDI